MWVRKAAQGTPIKMERMNLPWKAEAEAGRGWRGALQKPASSSPRQSAATPDLCVFLCPQLSMSSDAAATAAGGECGGPSVTAQQIGLDSESSEFWGGTEGSFQHEAHAHSPRGSSGSLNSRCALKVPWVRPGNWSACGSEQDQ